MNSLDLATILKTPNLKSQLGQVEQAMHKVLPSNPHIKKSLARLINAPGKRLRPSLVIAVAMSQSSEINQRIISGCVAIELIHIGSLVHDDIIDHADTRWNIPTINSQEGSARAIVLGDFLLAKACQVAATISTEVAGLVAGTITDLCDGQTRELADQYNLNRTTESLLKSMKGKTAALIAAACQVGGLCVGMNSQEVHVLDQYGEAFGMSFQLIDDLLDYLSSTELLGKSIGNDINEGVYTLPLLLSLKGPESEKIKKWVSQKERVFRPELVEIMLGNGTIKKTIMKAQFYNQSAIRTLVALDNKNLTGHLSNLPATYLDWAIKNLVAQNHRASLAKILV